MWGVDTAFEKRIKMIDPICGADSCRTKAVAQALSE
jgi:hypothetical protein